MSWVIVKINIKKLDGDYNYLSLKLLGHVVVF